MHRFFAPLRRARPPLLLGALLAAAPLAKLLGAQAPAAAPQMPDIRDIRGPVPLTFWEMHGLQIIAGAVLGVLVLALVAWLLLRKKPRPPPTPIERARQELAAARALLVTGQDKAFAILVSDTVRRYLEAAHHLPAPERTTEEFLAQIAGHERLHGELEALLRRFLEFCDLAKFAGQQFGAAEREQLLEAARQFVERAEALLHAPQAQPAGGPPAPGARAPASPPAPLPASAR